MCSSGLQVEFEYGPAIFKHSASTYVFRKKEVARDYQTLLNSILSLVANFINSKRQSVKGY